MPVPKKKHSRARQGTRRATWKVYAPNLSQCPECHSPILSHHACPSCGTYKGRVVVIKKEKKQGQAHEGKKAKKPSKEK